MATQAGVQDEPLASRRWIFWMTVAFLYAATMLRSLLAFEGEQRLLAVTLLLVWLGLLLTEPRLSRRWPPQFGMYVALQATIVVVLLPQSDSSDFFAVLFAILSMQAIQRWQPRRVVVLIGIFAVLTGVCTIDKYGPVQAATLAALYTTANSFLAGFALAVQRATEAKLRNEALVIDLQAANRQTADYARRAERLASARERQRLARDLHDSVTQTLFSMTLTAKSATLLLGRDPAGLQDQLHQIEHLANSALSEMSVLGGEQAASALTEGGLVTSLERHLAERAHQDGLSVSLEIDGGERLPEREAQTLLRVVQEALNNVVKHSGVSTAVVRLRLRRPFRLEVEDRGQGFDPARANDRGVGLMSMRERADEIGWCLSVVSSPGAGARVLVEEMSSDGGESGAGD
jgi:signal transduction histidine kinase